MKSMKPKTFAAPLDRSRNQPSKPRHATQIVAAILLFSLTLTAGQAPPAKAQGSPTPTPGALGTLGPQGQPELQSLVYKGTLDDLRWPNFSDYHGQAATFYGATGYALAWTDAGHPTQQALAMIQVFKNANLKGLTPEDYDASRWDARITKLAPATPTPAASDLVHFDLAMTICAMRYLSDLSIGRVNPNHLKFGPELA